MPINWRYRHSSATSTNHHGRRAEYQTKSRSTGSAVGLAIDRASIDPSAYHGDLGDVIAGPARVWLGLRKETMSATKTSWQVGDSAPGMYETVHRDPRISKAQTTPHEGRANANSGVNLSRASTTWPTPLPRLSSPSSRKGVLSVACNRRSASWSSAVARDVGTRFSIRLPDRLESPNEPAASVQLEPIARCHRAGGLRPCRVQVGSSTAEGRLPAIGQNHPP